VIKRFKTVRKGERFTTPEGEVWHVRKRHPKTKEVTAWHKTPGGVIEIRFRIGEINRFKWESPNA
jgi:hypothetical protein